MSLWDFRRAVQLDRDRDDAKCGTSFYSMIMALMMRADSSSGPKLRNAWPEVWDELDRRYNSPGGMLPEDPEAKAGEPSAE